MNIDRSFFIVFCQNAMTERTLSDVCSRQETVLDIVTGQIEDVRRVVEFNPAEGWSRDVTEEIAIECSSAIYGVEPSDVRRDLRDFIETYTGVGTVLKPAA